jgi:hypothetical protein
VGWGGFGAVGAFALAGHGRVVLFFQKLGGVRRELARISHKPAISGRNCR